jgi:small-conductance mechanosensitive channel
MPPALAEAPAQGLPDGLAGLPDWLRASLLGQPVSAWLAAVGLAVGLLLAVVLARRLVVRRFAALAARTATEADDLAVTLARRTHWWLLALPALYLGSTALAVPPRAAGVLRAAAIAGFTLQAAIWVGVGIDFWVARYRRRRLEVDAASTTTVTVLRFVAKLALWSLLLLVALDNLGVDVTALVAGLGVGGIAVALATQNILGDLFASLSIVIDKPFVIGDAIAVGDLQGTVETIGLKTTRLRAPTGEQLIFANGDLLQSRVKNLRRMTERRVVLTFGVAHGTPPERLEEVPALLRAAIEGRDQVRFERAHFKSFGPMSFDFELAYLLLTPDFDVYMDRQQEINLAILRGLAGRGIELAPSGRVQFLEAPKEGGRPARVPGFTAGAVEARSQADRDG